MLDFWVTTLYSHRKHYTVYSPRKHYTIWKLKTSSSDFRNTKDECLHYSNIFTFYFLLSKMSVKVSSRISSVMLFGTLCIFFVLKSIIIIIVAI